MSLLLSITDVISVRSTSKRIFGNLQAVKTYLRKSLNTVCDNLIELRHLDCNTMDKDLIKRVFCINCDKDMMRCSAIIKGKDPEMTQVWHCNKCGNYLFVEING